MKFADFPIWARLVAWALLALLVATVIFPFVWMVMTSFKSLDDYAANPFGLPQAVVFTNIAEAWATGGFLQLYASSLFITVVSVTGIVTFCGMAG